MFRQKFYNFFVVKIHFIAIGGSVMHQLAIALKQKGYEVSGSDDEIFDPARSNLLAAGILPAQPGWFPEKFHLSSMLLWWACMPAPIIPNC